MKNKHIFIMFLILSTSTISAQIGIGTTSPNNSAILDVVAEDKGVLIPKVELTGTTDVTTINNGNVKSLLVFNMATVADVVEGYYYWNGSKWLRVLHSDDLATGPADNFIASFNLSQEFGGIPAIFSGSTIFNVSENTITRLGNFTLGVEPNTVYEITVSLIKVVDTQSFSFYFRTPPDGPLAADMAFPFSGAGTITNTVFVRTGADGRISIERGGHANHTGNWVHGRLTIKKVR